MNKYRVELLKKEFPFLVGIKNLVCSPDLGDIDYILVKKADEDILEETGFEKESKRRDNEYYEYVKYFIVDANGGITEMESSETYINESGREEKNTTADPIDWQLFSKKITPQFIVKCEGGDDGYSWVIFKMKNLDLKNHHLKEIEKAAANLKAEIEAVFN